MLAERGVTSSPQIGQIDMKKVIQRKLHLGVGDGIVLVDGKPIYSAKDLKVGLFSAEQLEHM